ncbi:hypothetical protein TKK_0019206 [Trichogramma kaykai]|uniref:Fe2OG dioxygenase domain-containing protein n=1 Tax=Trichogramma kaykai TaxID=54128 RepID=A0ABD2VUV2_9HYME
MDTEINKILATNSVPGIPPQAYYIPNFITEEEENDIIQKIQSTPQPKWTQLSHRRLQNWGGIPHPKGMIAEEIPQWLKKQIDKIVELHIFDDSKRPNHVLINEYLPGQGIMPHSDGPMFHPIVTTISCGSHTQLTFYKRHDTNNIELPEKEFSLLLEPRSLLILQKDLYYNYLHSIEESNNDQINQKVVRNLPLCAKSFSEEELIPRSTRYSLTIRHVPKTSKFKIKLGK